MATTSTLEEMNFDKVCRIIRDSLFLEDSATISPQTRLVDLGAEDVDYLDIMKRLGVCVRDYIQDYESRKLTGRHSADLKSVSYIEDKKGNLVQAQHLTNLSSATNISDLISQLTVADCVSIGQYTIEKRQKVA